MGVGSIGRPIEVTGAVLSLLLATGLLTAAFLGPLVSDRIRFHMSSEAVAQYVGGEVVTVLLAVMLLLSGPGWWLNWGWVPIATAGAGAYVIYTFVTVVAGQEYGRYPGNAENAFLLYAAITAVAVGLLTTSWRRLLAGEGLEGPRHATGWVLVILGGAFALLWLGQLAGFYRDGPTREYESATSMFWLIKYLDLGVVIPVAVIVGLAQRSPSSASDAAAVTILGFLSWLLLALVFMAIEMLRRGTPGASWVFAIGVAVLLVPPLALFSRWLFRST